VEGVKRGRWDSTLHADEADNIRSHRLSLKRALRNQIRNVAALANNDLGDKREFACHFGACLGLGHWLPNDQRARRANIDGTQVLQRFGQLGRSESPVATDVDASQKNNKRHLIRLNERVRILGLRPYLSRTRQNSESAAIHFSSGHPNSGWIAKT
jgi:hypothetical protein